MKTPLVSVIIPCYRQAHYLATSIESALAQSCPAVEIVVVNDGSDDDTEAVARRYGDRIRYVWKSNGGLSSARNAGIAAATGDYLLFLDADDLLHPESVQILLEAMEYREDRLCLMGFRCFDDKVVPDHAPSYFPEPGLQMFPHLINKNLGVCHAFLCPTKAVKSVGGFDESLRACEDWDLWIRLGFAGLTLVSIPFAGAYYRQAQGTMSKDQRRMLESRTEVLLRTYSHIVQHPALLETLGSSLVEALYRIRRRGLVQSLALHALEKTSTAITELRRRGFYMKTSTPKKILDHLMGGEAEKLVLAYFRRFDPDAYAFYQRNYY